MDEKELLKKAFEYGNVPSNITYCFTEPCPMKNKCIHYLSALYKNEKTDRGDAIFPNALKKRELQVLRSAACRENGMGIRQTLCRNESERRSCSARRNERLPRQQRTILPLQTGTTETPAGTTGIYQTALRQIRI